MAEQHPYVRLCDQIAALPIGLQKKTLLARLGRYGDWNNDGARSYPSVKTLARDASLSERQVRRYLSSLRCDPFEPCSGDARCTHDGLLVVAREATRFYPTMYDLRLGPRSRQMHLPEISPATQQTAQPAAGPGAEAQHTA